MKHVIRIGPDWIRIPLLCLVWPFSVLGFVLDSLWRNPAGPGRVLEADFYSMPIAIFWAAWDGEFVPED